MKSKLIPLLITLVLTLGSQTLLAQPGAGGGGLGNQVDVLGRIDR